jgi:hypothetical protein
MCGDIAETVMLSFPLIASYRVIPTRFVALGEKQVVLFQPVAAFVLPTIRTLRPTRLAVARPPFPAHGRHAMFLACSASIDSA